VNVFLIGYRGCGKTAVGRTLSRILGLAWVDMDAVLAERFGRSIAEHVDRFGWGSFREMERRLLIELCERDGQVVSTGGGVGADPEHAAAMRRSGTVVWLRAEPATIGLRLAADDATAAQRPALRAGAGDTLGEIRAVLLERTPAYAAAADIVVETDRIMIPEAAVRIARHLGCAHDANPS
jgi:shikimate kinase